MQRFPLAVGLVVVAGCPSGGGAPRLSTGYEVVARLDQAPGNVTVGPNGTIVVSLHQFFEPDVRVARVEGGELVPLEVDLEVPLDAVLGVQFDPDGNLWLLDNGLRGGTAPRLVATTREGGPTRVIDLGAVARDGSFFNDLAIDSSRGVAYIADPAGGPNAALVVVDLETGSARRLLEGHESVVPEDLDLVIDGEPVERQMPDGSTVRPHIGVNPIALDATNDQLYFGPMHGTTLYRVPTGLLRDPQVDREALASAVQSYADKPICDGIAIDDEGNVYLGILARDAVGVIRPDGTMEVLAEDDELAWIDAFAFGPDGGLYAVANQLHRVAALNRGRDATEPPFLVLRLTPLASGVVGR